MTHDEMIAFANKLAEVADAKHPGVYIQVKTIISGHYAIILHINGEAECYVVNPVADTWIKHYGPL